MYILHIYIAQNGNIPRKIADNLSDPLPVKSGVYFYVFATQPGKCLHAETPSMCKTGWDRPFVAAKERSGVASPTQWQAGGDADVTGL